MLQEYYIHNFKFWNMLHAGSKAEAIEKYHKLKPHDKIKVVYTYEEFIARL